MSLRSKAKAKLKREKLAQQRELEEKKLKQNMQRLKSMKGGFSTDKTVKGTMSNMPTFDNYRKTTHYASVNSNAYACTLPLNDIRQLPDELQERELLARQETERKKKCVAPLYNKGGLQYVTEGMDLTTLGRKV